MKYLLIFLTFNAYANFFPVGKDGAKTTYGQKELCEKQESAPCFNITGKDYRYYDVAQKTVEESDYGKPIYGQNKLAKECAEGNCYKILMEYRGNNTCSEAGEGYFPKQKESMVVCAIIDSYEKNSKVVKYLKLNEEKKAAIEGVEKEKRDLEEEIEIELQNQKFGQELYARIKVLHNRRGFTKNQKKQIRSNFAEIRNLLLDGDIEMAKEEIEKIEPVENLILQEDIDSILAIINNHLGV